MVTIVNEIGKGLHLMVTKITDKEIMTVAEMKAKYEKNGFGILL